MELFYHHWFDYDMFANARFLIVATSVLERAICDDKSSQIPSSSSCNTELTNSDIGLRTSQSDCGSQDFECYRKHKVAAGGWTINALDTKTKNPTGMFCKILQPGSISPNPAYTGPGDHDHDRWQSSSGMINRDGDGAWKQGTNIFFFKSKQFECLRKVFHADVFIIEDIRVEHFFENVKSI